MGGRDAIEPEHFHGRTRHPLIELAGEELGNRGFVVRDGPLLLHGDDAHGEHAGDLDLDLAVSHFGPVLLADVFRLVTEVLHEVFEVALVAGVFGSIADGSIIPAGEGLLAAELQGAGLTEPEILLAFRAVESFMLHAGALNYAGGTLLVTPRTRDLMLSISSAVSQTIGATERELERGEELLESVEAEQGEGS